MISDEFNKITGSMVVAGLIIAETIVSNMIQIWTFASLKRLHLDLENYSGRQQPVPISEI